MDYTHKTTHSFKPDVEFWRPFENLLKTFPHHTGINLHRSFDELIKFFEDRTGEAFDITNNDLNIYGNPIREEWVFPRGIDQGIRIHEMTTEQRNNITVNNIVIRINNFGKIIKFLENCISNPNKVHKFQHFIESFYYYLMEINELNPNNHEIRRHGVNNKKDPNYERKKEEFLNKNGGLYTPTEFLEFFNSICRKYGVPFAILSDGYVVYITDVFIEKIIHELPVFLKRLGLNQANKYFLKAYKERDQDNNSESLNNIRKGMEKIRDYIFIKYSITPNPQGNLTTDLKSLLDSNKDKVFDFNKIPTSDPKKLDKIIKSLKETILLISRLCNLGAHASSQPDLIEENTSLFLLGQVASIIPYIFYLLK